MSVISLILAIDTGSSSVRCTAYELFDVLASSNIESNAKTGFDEQRQRPLFRPIDGANHTVSMSTIVPNVGYIRIHKVLTAIDDCIDQVLSLIRKIGRETNSNYQVVAVGFSTFVMNMVGVDKWGEPVGEVATLSYACNRKDVLEECTNLTKNLNSEKLNPLYQRTGAPIHPAYALPQLLAFYRNSDDHTCKKVHQWQTISSICLHRWTGDAKIHMPISYSEASWTGMMNFRMCTWDEDYLSILISSDVLKPYEHEEMSILPSLQDFDIANEASGSFLRGGIPPQREDGSQNSYWDRWPELRGQSTSDANLIPYNENCCKVEKFCRFFLGVGDGAAANIGSKCDSSNSDAVTRMCVTIGTSAAARVCLPLSIKNNSSCEDIDDIEVPYGLFCYRVDKNRVLLGGALTDGGSVIEWARSLLNLNSQLSFDNILEQVSEMYLSSATFPESFPKPTFTAENGGITMIPFLSGERSTEFRGSATACISGLTRETTPMHFMYSCLEGVILRLAAVITLMYKASNNKQGHGKHSYLIVASGNALERNSLWRQMLADCTGMCVVVDGDSKEGTSRGVASLIARSLMHPESRREVIIIVQKSCPVSARESKWISAKLSQEKLINALCSTWNGV